MYFSILNLGQTPCVARSPDIPFLVPVSFDLTIYYGSHHVGANIKFPAIVQERIGDIALQNQAFRRRGLFFVFGLDFVGAALNSFADFL